MLLDARCVLDDVSKNIHTIIVQADDDLMALFMQTLQYCDAALPLAPETAHILWTFCTAVEQAGKRLLTSPASAVAKTADKMTTFDILSAHGIATIPSHLLAHRPQWYTQGTVIKARDGVGCEQCFVCEQEADFVQLLSRLPNHEHYLIQPFMQGMALSVSALFQNGRAQLLCINRQLLTIQDQQFNLTGCEVNYPLKSAAFQTLLNDIAAAIPDLWGYVGIDLIQHAQQLRVVEINPRLTSSYAGIHDALGLNVAELILQLLDGTAQIVATHNHLVHLKLAH